MTTQYITIIHWERFQHYKDRNPPWIKTYTELLSSEAYLRLPGNRRAILHGLWLDYATKHGELTHDTRMISRRLSLKVTTSDLQALEAAGFIALPSTTEPNLASSVLAERLQPASASRALARGREKTQDQKQQQDQNPATAIASLDAPRANGHHNEPATIASTISNSLAAAGIAQPSAHAGGKPQ
jgi:hypothetical protein